MGKKGAKRKTRWRTLSIGTPPGEEDEEDGSRNGYLIKSNHESGRASSDRNGYGPPWLKSRHGSAGSSGSGNSNGQASHAGSTTSGYGSGGSRSRRTCSDGLDSPTNQQQGQQRIVFNEDEYTRITTPRQDMLFKKGYLGQKKPWNPSNASMSATPSTTESQSASHSTADGSEAAEDQQLLDTGGVPAEYAPQLIEAIPPGPAQMSYGTYYDHTSGYFYEYPMMLVGPAIPDEMGQPNMLAAMPCAPVPLRPIEWVNPAFVPKLASQQYCFMDYQGAPATDCAALVDAQGLPLSGPDLGPESLLPITNGLSNEASLTGGSASASASASASGSLADEPLANNKLTLPVTLVQEPDQEIILKHQEPMQEIVGVEDEEKLPETEVLLEEAPMEGMEYAEAAAVPATPYVETLPPQPVHLAHMMAPPMGHQPAYLYPGQYMFGPPVVNVNGVTIQSGPMLRCNDMLANTAAVACAKRRKKKRKRKQKRPHALGNTEDEDEEDYSSEGENGLPSPRVSWSATPTIACSLSNRPLNPECQEFHLRSGLADSTPESFSDSCGTSSIPATTTITTFESNGEVAPEEDCNGPAVTLNNYHHHADNEEATTRLTDEPAETADVDSKDLENGMDHNLTNGCDEDEEKEKQEEEEEVTKNCRTSNGGLTAQPRRKYSAKALKFVREATPGPDLDDETNNHEEAQRDVAVDELTLVLSTTTIIEAQATQNDADLDISRSRANEESPATIASESCCDEMQNDETTSKTTTTAATGTITATDEDSGFESQSKHGYSARPITDAVNEWLKRANSPDLFITSSATSDEDEEDEEDASLGNEPSKNLQGNPMPALSVNGAGAEKREASRGRVAETGESSTGSSNDEAVKTGGPSLKGSRNVRGARRKGAKSHRRNQESQLLILDTQTNKLDMAQEQAQVSVEISDAPPGKALDGICNSAEKDSDVGMRVAENSRINVRSLDESADSTVIRRALEEACKERCVGDIQAVKTFEKGEIVVSMDGELLLVASELRDTARRNSDSTLEDEHRSSLGSIEEPDVLECWEAETVEPVVSPKKTLEANEDDDDDDDDVIDDLLVTKDNGPDGMEHVQRYYRLQADSSVSSSVEDDTRDNLVVNDNLDASKSKTVPNTPDRMTDSVSSIEEIPVILPVEEKPESITDYHSKLPIDEAFEVYESCYTGKPLNFASIDPKFDKSPFMSRDEEGPIPCKAVCCNIQ